MTAVVDPPTVASPPVGLSHRPVAVVAVAGGCLLLVARPPLLGSVGNPQAALVVMFVALLAVGWAWPLTSAAPRTLPSSGVALRARSPFPSGVATAQLAAWRRPQNGCGHGLRWAVLGVGVAAFAVGRLLGGGEAPSSAVLPLVALSSLAAVAEEAFFRRLAFAALLPGGAALAVVGSAALFAVVHVTVYGAWVLPLDLAAGLVLSWQRWATGAWGVPAVTHVVANLLVVF